MSIQANTLVLGHIAVWALSFNISDIRPGCYGNRLPWQPSLSVIFLTFRL